VLTVGSLFAGIGGFDLGLERTGGFRTAWFCEQDPYCQRVLAKHWPGVPCFPDVRALGAQGTPRVHVLCGGFPCQPVSQNGRRLAQADERWLWPEFARLVRELRPQYGTTPMGEAATNVVPLIPRDVVCDPVSGEVISPSDAQHRLNAQRDEIEALTKALASAHRLNASQATQIKNLKEERAEDACEDPKLVRDLIVFHYARFGRKRTPGKIPLSGLDAVIVRWLLDQADFTARDVALMSVGFAENDFYREKGMVSLMNCATTKVDGKRVKDSEKAWRFREAGAKLKGEA
jgi:hypothetical protein